MFHRLAEEYRDGLKELRQTTTCLDSQLAFPLDLPGEVLACLCIEMAIKGVLRGHGWCIDHLRGAAPFHKQNNVGHDLIRAHSLATAAGMPSEMVSEETDAAVVTVLGDHWRRRDLPYTRLGAYNTVGGAHVVSLCDRLIAGTAAFCQGNKDVHVLKLDALGIVQNRDPETNAGCGCPIPDKSIDR
jgi:hypothetical protein